RPLTPNRVPRFRSNGGPLNATGTDAVLDGLRAGEVATADRVFREFEPALRRAVRRRLPGRVRCRIDSTDVVQSVCVSILSARRSGRTCEQHAGRTRTLARLDRRMPRLPARRIAFGEPTSPRPHP